MKTGGRRWQRDVAHVPGNQNEENTSPAPSTARDLARGHGADMLLDHNGPGDLTAKIQESAQGKLGEVLRAPAVTVFTTIDRLYRAVSM